jgi:aromatic ring-opening dioxygenase catalytic subunit (LigB family)
MEETRQDKSGTYPSLYIPHGGGPCFFMDWTMGPADTWQRMGAWLGQLAGSVGPKPKAVLVVSAHWEEPQFTVTSNPRPPLIYDYYGFPEHTYRLKYDAPGAPALAEEIKGRLEGAGVPAATDAERGLDHGVFVPFKLIFPTAEVPTLQLSLKAGLDPAAHLAAGHALAPLREEGVLIVGSGMSYHNMRGLMGASGAATVSERFDAWLSEAAAAPDPVERERLLAAWQSAPVARGAHPREEHLLPLMVAAGAAPADQGRKIFEDHVMGVTVSAFQFGSSLSPAS